MQVLDQLRSAASLGRALNEILAHFCADSGTIHSLRVHNQLHLRAASQGMPPAVLDLIKVIPVGKGMAGLAVHRNEPVTACNIQTDVSGNVRQGAKLTGLEGAIVVPIRNASGVPVGALGIANRESRTFSETEISELQRCADTLAARADF